LTIVVATSLLSGCATPHPVIYEAAPGASHDVEQCMQLARAAGADSGKGASAARDVGVGAAMGGAAAGAWGGVRGYSDVGQRAAAGAAAGASVALIRGVSRANEPTEVFRGYVNQCLRERGHQVVGWR
jgi:outer membrane lipoprotein SlyB